MKLMEASAMNEGGGIEGGDDGVPCLQLKYRCKYKYKYEYKYRYKYKNTIAKAQIQIYND